MSSKALRTVIVSTFGANATSPQLAAAFKLCFSFASAGVLGIVTREFIQTVGISSDLPASLVLAMVTTLGFMLTGLVLFSFGYSGIIELRNNNALKVLSVLPLQRRSLFLLHNISAFVLVSICYVFMLPSALYVAATTLVPYWHVLFVVALGCIGCYGLIAASFTQYFSLKFAMYALGIYGMGRSINRVITSGGDFSYLKYVYLICGVCIVLAAVSAIFLQTYIYRERLQAVRLRWPRFLIIHFWFVVKFLRNKKSRTSFLFSFFVLCVSAFILRKNPGNVVAEDWLRIIAFMTMAVCCDARVTFRKHKPLEAYLKGVGSFVRVELQSLRLLTMLMGVPLLIVVLAATHQPFWMVLNYISLQMLAVSIGVLAGSLLASTPDNTGGQLLSVIFGGVLLYGCLITISKYAGVHMEPLGYAAFAILFGVVGESLEYKRQRSYGHA